MKNTIMPDLRGYETFKIFVQLHVQNQYIRMIRNILFFFCWTCLFESWMNAPKKSSIACFNLVAFCVWTKIVWMRLLYCEELSSWKAYLFLIRDATWEATTFDREHQCWLKSTLRMIQAFRMRDKGKEGGTIQRVWLSL